MGVNYYLPPELEERRKKYLDIPQYRTGGGRTRKGSTGPGPLDIAFDNWKQRKGQQWNQFSGAVTDAVEKGIETSSKVAQNIKDLHASGADWREGNRNWLMHGNREGNFTIPIDRRSEHSERKRHIQAEKQKTIEDIAKYRAANPLESDVGPPQFEDKSGRKGAGETYKKKAIDEVVPGSATEENLIENDVDNNNDDDAEKVEARSTSNEKVLNDGNPSVLTEWTTDQDVNEEATIVPGSEMAVSKEDNKQYQEDIVDKPPETKDPPKTEKKDGPFSTAADTVNTLNSMIKGLSTIMANMNPDAKSATFANVDYFKNKMALDDWRKRMYGRQSRA